MSLRIFFFKMSQREKSAKWFKVLTNVLGDWLEFLLIAINLFLPL